MSPTAEVLLAEVNLQALRQYVRQEGAFLGRLLATPNQLSDRDTLQELLFLHNIIVELCKIVARSTLPAHDRTDAAFRQTIRQLAGV